VGLLFPATFLLFCTFCSLHFLEAQNGNPHPSITSGGSSLNFSWMSGHVVTSIQIETMGLGWPYNTVFDVIIQRQDFCDIDVCL
jgi:hypothetical protein